MLERIAIDPNTCHGRPTVCGTRITAQTVLEEYPTLTRKDVLACLEYGARVLSHRLTLERTA